MVSCIKSSTVHIGRILALTFFAIFIVNPAIAEEEEKQTLLIEKWLLLGKFEVMPPAFSLQKNIEGEVFKNTNLLDYNYIHFDQLSPEEDKEVKWKAGTYKWETIKTAKSGFAFPGKNNNKDKNELAYLATYINADQWSKVTLEVSSPQMFEVYIDGKKIKTKKSIEDAEGSPGDVEVDLKLKRGKHLLMIKTLKTKNNSADWMVKANLKINDGVPEKAVSVGISPTKTFNIEHLLNGEFINNVSISPDGRLVLLNFSEVTPPDGDKKSWSEVRNLETGKLFHSFRGSKMHNIKWLPIGSALSLETSNGDKGSSVWVYDFKEMIQKKILKNINDFGSFTWSPDGAFIIYTISEDPDDKSDNLKRYEGMPDRWPWWRSRSFLYKMDVFSGATERLTYGHVSTNLHDISPDGTKILFSQSLPNFTERPFSKQFLMEMDLLTYVVDTLWEKNFSGQCQYAPDGEHLLVTGSPALFGKTGINVTGNVIPNDYDTQAYIFDPDTDDVDPITFNFNPSINSASWSKYDDNTIYFLAGDKTYRRIFSYDLNTRYFSEIKTGIDVVNSFSLAKSLPIAVFTGSGISTPKYAAAINLSDGEITTICNPRWQTYNNVEFGETEEWVFTNKNGVDIDGRIYYPPNFDKKKKYPLIVYYYGGTSPTERSFGGRYPKNLFASQGYVVYNLQPSGATGYGQDFSAAHVNNWGITVTDEIIDGTKQFLDAHDFINADKIGCIGASYGGFLTMLLQTRTNIFAAAISHAGISSISSYWGEGYWGYLYSSVASANSFPWNNKKLYIDQSALFNADKINTPLLLLHGSDDTNVPPGESIQLYTALKLLDKPVEYIEIKGQNHQILDYKKRIEWQNTIFAWFDKWLKDQPDWWNEMYPDRNL